MPWPTMIRVWERFVDAAGQPLHGGLSAILTGPLHDPTNANADLAPRLISAGLNSNGEVEILVPASNDPAATPNRQLQFWEHLAGGNDRTFNLTVPYNATNGRVQLSQIAGYPARTGPRQPTPLAQPVVFGTVDPTSPVNALTGMTGNGYGVQGIAFGPNGSGVKGSASGAQAQGVVAAGSAGAAAILVEALSGARAGLDMITGGGPHIKMSDANFDDAILWDATGDLRFLSSAIGPILVDTANANNKWRLRVTNGALVLQAAV